VRRAALIAASVLALTGCGATQRKTRTTPSKLAQAEASHEYPSPPPPPQGAAGARSTGARAVRDFATAYINWTAQTVPGDMASLAARSVGQARSAMALAAAQTTDDYELRRGGISNHGTVEAVARLAGRPDQYVVVTLESTSATNTTAYQGLRPAWHVALATVTEQQPDQWVVSGWQPEN
jgi:hypothetical protein